MKKKKLNDVQILGFMKLNLEKIKDIERRIKLDESVINFRQELISHSQNEIEKLNDELKGFILV